MYPRGRKVCFATAGFLLIAKTRIYLRSCGIPTGKKCAGLACGIGNILRAGRPGGGNRLFPAGWQAGERRPQKGGQAMRLGGGGRTDGAGGGSVLPARRAGKTKAGAGAEGPRPCFVRAVRARRPGGPGNARAHALWARAAQNPGGKGRGWARRLGQSRCP